LPSYRARNSKMKKSGKNDRERMDYMKRNKNNK
jgi:hypothetical protein